MDSINNYQDNQTSHLSSSIISQQHDSHENSTKQTLADDKPLIHQHSELDGFNETSSSVVCENDDTHLICQETSFPHHNLIAHEGGEHVVDQQDVEQEEEGEGEGIVVIEEQQVLHEEQGQGNNPVEQFSNLISLMNNEPFLNEETLTGIYELLHLNTTEMFDEIDMKEPTWKFHIEQLLKKRLEIYNKKVEIIANIYQQNLPNNQMHNIEKIMSIIKSKQKEIHIFKIDKSPRCSHHSIVNHPTFTSCQNEQQNEGSVPCQMDGGGLVQLTPSLDSHVQVDESLCKLEGGVEEDCQSVQEGDIGKEDMFREINGEDNAEESVEMQLAETEETRLEQEEQKKNLIEENQRLRLQYQEMLEKNRKLKSDYHQQIEVENVLLRREAAAQLIRYTYTSESQSQDNSDSLVGGQHSQQQQMEESTLVLNDEELSSNTGRFQQQVEEEEKLTEECERNEGLSVFDIQAILQMQFVDLKRFQQLNTSDNSITFDMNNNYVIKIRNCEEVRYDRTSMCARVPHFIFQNHIFGFLSSVELFRMSGVSPEWREMVREGWHKTFKREMQEQLLATDLCKEIEAQFKLMHIRNPFFQKLNVLVRAMMEVINWEEFERKCLDNDLTYRDKKIVVALLRILGYNMFNYDHINEFEEDHFARMNVDIALHLKDFMQMAISGNSVSSEKVKKIHQNFLCSADISISSLTHNGDKNSIIFILISKQFFIYSLLKNYIISSSTYMGFAKTKLDSLSKDWPTSKGFLEGAYRILLLRNVTIKNCYEQGQIVNKEEETEEINQLTRKQNNKKQQRKVSKRGSKKEEIGEKNANNEQKSRQNERNCEEFQTNSDSHIINQSSETQEKYHEMNDNSSTAQHEDQGDQGQEDQGDQDQENQGDQGQEDQGDQDQENQGDQEDQDQEEEDEQGGELSQLMKSIFNLNKTNNNEPDIVIKRKTGVLKIFLDQGTKLDIILNSVISVGISKMQKINQVQEEAIKVVENSKNTLEELEKRFNENKEQIDKMKLQSEDLEKRLLTKQAELQHAINSQQASHILSQGLNSQEEEAGEEERLQSSKGEEEEEEQIN